MYGKSAVCCWQEGGLQGSNCPRLVGGLLQAQWGHHGEASYLSTASAVSRQCSTGHPACLGDPGVGLLPSPPGFPGGADSYREGSWYVIMMLSSVLAISSQMGSCKTHLMNCSLSSVSAIIFAL